MKARHFLLTFMIINTAVFILHAEEKVININGKISSIKVYKNFLYILNQTENNIWRFDESLNLVSKIGQQGQGPGEISRLSDFNFVEDKIYTFSSGNRLLVFDLKGNLLSESKFHDVNGSILLLKNGKAVRKSREYSYDKGKAIVYTISFLDAKFNNLGTFLNERLIIPPKFEWEAVEPYIEVKYSEKAGLIFVSNPIRDYLIMVFDENGHQVGQIFKKNYGRVKADQSFKDRFLEAMLNSPDKPPTMNPDMIQALFKTLHFSKYLPAFESFYLDDEGNAYIRTFKKKGQNALYEKYTPRGKFIKEYLLDDRLVDILATARYIAFSATRFYYLYENEKGEYVLHIEKLE